MPRVELTYSAGALSDDAKRELPRQLAESMLRWEGAPDTDFFRAISWVHVHELPADAVFTADGPAQLSQFVVDVSVPEGGLSDRRRAGLVEEFTKLIREAAGLPEEEGIRVWVLVHEIAEGRWGAGGQIIQFEQLRQAAKAEREKAAAPA
ncbi:MAG TPA: tautomerase family protein [Thermoleophilaceae bacterium]|nr:tautomerase family protein [Thermoleophilaceae bacterium]